MVSPERAAPLAHAHVLLRDGHIASVDTRPPQTSPAVVVDGAGRFLVPGFIDGHVHLAEIPGVTREAEATMPDVVAAYFRGLPRSYLYFGFTTVVDLNVVDRARVEAVRKAHLGPTVLDCGNGLALANGYPMALIPSPLRFALYPNFLYDPAQAGAIRTEYVPADHTVSAAIARVTAGGGVCVKTYYERGFGPLRGKLPLPTADMVRDVVAQSHRAHVPVLLHANSLEAHQFAVQAGVDVAAHGLWNWEKADGDVAEGVPAAVRAVIDDEIHRGIGVMPTSRVISGLEDVFAPGFLDDPELANVLPRELITWYRSAGGQWFASDTEKDFDGMPRDGIRRRFRAIGDRGRAAAYYFATHGGRLLFGSDTPSAPTYANPPGYNGYLEMRELERAGITPRDILAAATIENARVFGLAAALGTIEPGKRADLLLLGADPLASTSAFSHIEAVVIGGRIVRRGELSARVAR